MKKCGCGLKPQIKIRIITSRHKMLMACTLCVCFVWHKYRLHLNNISFMEEGGMGNPGPPLFPLRLRPPEKQHLKTKTIWHLLLLAPCEVFSITLNFACISSWTLFSSHTKSLSGFTMVKKLIFCRKIQDCSLLISFIWCKIHG